MNFPKDTNVSALDNEENGSYTVSINGCTYDIDKGELQSMMTGMADDFPTLKGNIAIALALAGINVYDGPAVIKAIESRTFKMFR